MGIENESFEHEIDWQTSLKAAAIIGGLFALSEFAFPFVLKRKAKKDVKTCQKCGGNGDGKGLVVSHDDHGNNNSTYEILCVACEAVKHYQAGINGANNGLRDKRYDIRAARRQGGSIRDNPKQREVLFFFLGKKGARRVLDPVPPKSGKKR